MNQIIFVIIIVVLAEIILNIAGKLDIWLATGFKKYRKFFVRRNELKINSRYIQYKSNCILFILMSVLIWLQKKNNIEFFNFEKVKTDNIIAIYSFICAVLALYGIYLAFLQFLVENSDTYLGINKANRIINYSNYYQLTQAPIFIVLLLLFISLPIFLIENRNEFGIYVWQTICIILIVLYPQLLSLNLKAISILFGIKEKNEDGIKSLIELEIKYKYFDKLQKGENNYESFLRLLEEDLKKISTKDLDVFLLLVFGKNNLPYLMDFDVSKNLNAIYFKNKWKIIEKYKEYISNIIYEELLSNDINLLICLCMKDKKDTYFSLFKDLYVRLITSFGNNEFNNMNADKNRNVFIFSYIKNLKVKSKIEKIKLECIISYWLENNSKTDIIDFLYAVNELSDIHKRVYEYLIDNIYLVREHIKSNKYREILNLLDEDRMVAFLFLALMYPDENKSFEWSDNFFELEKILEEKICLKSKEEYSNVYRIIDDSNVNTKIDSKVLKKLMSDSDKVIDKDNYFKSFNYSRLSELNIIYMELLFDRITFHNDVALKKIKLTKDTVKSSKKLCWEYLYAVSKNTSILNDESLEKCIRKLINHTTLGYIFYDDQINMKGLLYLEYSISKKKMRNFLLSNICEGNSYYVNEQIFEFLTLKLNAVEYNKLFLNKLFLKSFKVKGIQILDKKNLNVKQYLNFLQDKLGYMSLGNESKQIIENKLRRIFEE